MLEEKFRRYVLYQLSSITESVIDSYLHVEPTRLIFFMVLRAMFIIFGLKSIIKQLLNLVYGFLHWKCIIKQLFDSVFVICKIINVDLGKSYHPCLRLA